MFIFISLFFTILRSVAVPAIAILLLRSSFLGEQGSTLAVTISLTVANFFLILWQVIKIIPNIVLLRAAHLVKLLIEIAIEIVSVLGFWIYFLGLQPV